MQLTLALCYRGHPVRFCGTLLSLAALCWAAGHPEHLSPADGLDREAAARLRA